MKKKLLFITLLLFATACTANYEIVYDGNELRESVTIDGLTREGSSVESFPFNELEEEKINLIDKSDKFFDQSVTVEEGIYTINYNGSHEIENFPVDSLMLHCYERVYVVDKRETLLVSTFGSNSHNGCFSSDVKANLTTDYVVVSSNADSIEGNTHVWDMENHVDGIEFLIDKEKMIEKEVSIVSKLNIAGIVFGAIIILASVPIYKILKSKLED